MFINNNVNAKKLLCLMFDWLKKYKTGWPKNKTINTLEWIK